MMMAMNKWSVAYLSVALVASGEGVEFISFTLIRPEDLDTTSRLPKHDDRH